MLRHFRLLAAALVLLGALARLQVHRNSGFTDDDAFITFRYANQLAHGAGFVYNPGERVLGTSTPLFTLLLAAGARAGLAPPRLSFALGLLGCGATGALLYLLLEGQGRPWAGIFALLLQTFAVGPGMLADVGGMETPVYAALVVAALFLYARGRTAGAAASAALAALTHPEGALLAVALAAAYVLERRRVPWVEVGVFAALVLPWAAFAWSYFGSPVPNSVLAKRAFFLSHDPQAPLTVLAMFHLGRVRTLLALLAVVGAGASVWRPALRPVVLWAVLYLAFFLAGGVPVHYWYLLPYFAAVYALAGMGLDLGVAALAALFGPRGSVWRERAALAGTLAVVAALGAFGSVNLARERVAAERGQQLLAATHRQIGVWLAAHTPRDAEVYVGDIGYAGWISGRRILDPVGLVSPQAARWNLRHDPVGLIRQRLPAVCVLGMYGQDYRTILDDAWFRGHYRPCARIRDAARPSALLPDDDPARAGQYVPDYAIYCRGGGET